jgi:hypothetical protein
LIVSAEPFLLAKFKIKAMKIDIVPSNNILPDALKKVWFDQGISETSIVIEFTLTDSPEFSEFRRFGSVKTFME